MPIYVQRSKWPGKWSQLIELYVQEREMEFSVRSSMKSYSDWADNALNILSYYMNIVTDGAIYE